jgi:UDP-2-acetamido-2-deoxy-ribo-hexuluronate aminotransferase
MEFIDLKKQQEKIKYDLKSRIDAVLNHGQYIRGPEINEIESRLSEFCGAKHAIACANGTDALQIALMALDLDEGDEVITTPFTFFATAEVIALLKLKPVFVDIDPKAYNIDVLGIESKITRRTKVIMPVSLYGQCADMDEINKIAARHNIAVIEDAAQSFGALYKDRKSCNVSTIATTSFFPSKPLGCYGDGGMIFTSDDDIARKISIIANHGQEKRYHHTVIGVNSRLDTIQAAILLSKMNVFEEEIKARTKIGEYYTKNLQSYVRTPFIKDDRSSVYAQYTIEVNNRDDFCARIKEEGIPTVVHYPISLHMQPVFKNLGWKEGDFPHSENAAKRVVSLPMHPYMDQEQQDFIIQKVKECI